MREIICMEHITKVFRKRKEEKKVLQDISMTIHEGDFVGIIGKSGAGKTTILKIVGLLAQQTEGVLKLFGTPSDELSSSQKAKIRNEKIGFVLQDYALIDSYSVVENVEIPLRYATNKISSKQRRVQVEEILKKLDMETHIDDSCQKLSGGERQRVAIARALINDPELIIADEPTGALDENTALELLEHLTKLNRELKKTILLVTHDKSMLRNCTKVYELENGVLQCVNEKSPT